MDHRDEIGKLRVKERFAVPGQHHDAEMRKERRKPVEAIRGHQPFLVALCEAGTHLALEVAQERRLDMEKLQMGKPRVNGFVSGTVLPECKRYAFLKNTPAFKAIEIPPNPRPNRHGHNFNTPAEKIQCPGGDAYSACRGRAGC
jgi:hypothetical protein